MCTKILEHAGKLNMDEYNFFLRGGVVSIIYKSTEWMQLCSIDFFIQKHLELFCFYSSN